MVVISYLSLLQCTRIAAFIRPGARLAASTGTHVRPSSSRPSRLQYAQAEPPSTAIPSVSAMQDTAIGGKEEKVALINIYSLNEEELANYLKEYMQQPKYRSKQIRSWLYQRGASSFEQMNDLPKALRAGLAEHFRLGSLEVAFEQRSKDGTIKRAYKLEDNYLIESVLMVYEDGRRTACISSQAGCAMGCKFCATGQNGFQRQLKASEIFEQALLFARDLIKDGERLSNVVMMGEGEPLNNRGPVLAALRRLNGELGIGARHLTISTVGLAPRIRDLADDEEALLSQIKLAVSLHAANDAERSELMPVNKRFNIQELMNACQYYVEKTNRRITFEYALIEGQNDGPRTAQDLGDLLLKNNLKGKCHVNLIPVNPTPGFDGRPSAKGAIQRFINILSEDYGIPATLRIRRGIDIDAGCGQLKGKLMAQQQYSK